VDRGDAEYCAQHFIITKLQYDIDGRGLASLEAVIDKRC